MPRGTTSKRTLKLKRQASKIKGSYKVGSAVRKGAAGRAWTPATKEVASRKRTGVVVQGKQNVARGSTKGRQASAQRASAITGSVSSIRSSGPRTIARKKSAQSRSRGARR